MKIYQSIQNNVLHYYPRTQRLFKQPTSASSVVFDCSKT